jgi:hypothetical protein
MSPDDSGVNSDFDWMVIQLNGQLGNVSPPLELTENVLVGKFGGKV